MNLIEYLSDHFKFSQDSYGPGKRYKPVLEHIKLEVVEVEEDPDDVEEWIDIAILAMDGALRTGATPEQVCETFQYKLEKNKNRKWPDWRTADPDKPIQHIKG